MFYVSQGNSPSYNPGQMSLGHFPYTMGWNINLFLLFLGNDFKSFIYYLHPPPPRQSWLGDNSCYMYIYLLDNIVRENGVYLFLS